MDGMLQHLEQAARERAEHTEAKRQIRDVKQQMLAEVLTQRTALRPAPPPPPPTFVTPEILLAGIEEAARALAEQAEAKRETAAAKDDVMRHVEEAARKREALAEAKREIAAKA